MNRLAIFMALPLLAGCDMHSKNPANGDDNVTINADESGHISFNLPIGQGQLKVPTGFMHHGNFDIDGVKLPPGSSVTGFSVFARDEGSTVNMSFSAPTSADDVRSYFVGQFKKQGVDASLSGDAVTGKTKNGSPFTINVTPTSNGSKGKIEVQSKD
jgi:hypothetical protein